MSPDRPQHKQQHQPHRPHTITAARCASRKCCASPLFAQLHCFHPSASEVHAQVPLFLWAPTAHSAFATMSITCPIAGATAKIIFTNFLS
mmetsp:Transcript_72449/g.143630  ORF Transcript_72449/g.143630 Transcript_72449/m.143630 type:complete len:90 (-) Transcript_72449:496-765(-)